MKGTRVTLLAIAAFVALTLGSFIWFIATWDKSKEEPVSWLDHTKLEERRA